MSNKHDANVRKSTLVNFQIGLIASLLFTYMMFEMYTSVSVIESRTVVSANSHEANYTIDVFREEREPKKEIIVKIQTAKKQD